MSVCASGGAETGGRSVAESVNPPTTENAKMAAARMVPQSTLHIARLLLSFGKELDLLEIHGTSFADAAQGSSCFFRGAHGMIALL